MPRGSLFAVSCKKIKRHVVVIGWTSCTLTTLAPLKCAWILKWQLDIQLLINIFCRIYLIRVYCLSFATFVISVACLFFY